MDKGPRIRLPFFRDGVPLQVTVLTAFLLIYIPAVTLIVYYNHMVNRDRAEEDVGEQIELMAGRIVERQQRFFQPAADWAAVWARRMALVHSPVAEMPKNLPSALETLARNPQFYSVLVGTGPGGEQFEVFQVSRVIAGGSYGVNPADLPGDVQYASWLIDRVRGQPERREFFDGMLRRVMKATVEPTKLVLWTRPWYRIAQEQSGVAMEGPFLFGSGQRMGISFSHRFVGTKPGAVAVTVLLADFAEFLQENRVGKHGYSVVFDEKGRVIALGDPTGKALAAFTRGQGEQQMPKLSESNIPAVSWLNGHLPKNGERRQEFFTVDGKKYKALMVPLRSPFTGNLHLGLVVSMEEFLNPIYRETAITAIISMAIALAAVPFIFWLAFQISRPIQRLTEEARRVARLEFGQPVRTHSPIAEVRQLFSAFAGMTQGLGAFTKFVPRNVVEEVLLSHKDPVPGGESRRISIMFTDVQDFTHMSEGMPPRDLFRKATSYYAQVGSPILASGGVIGRFMGDGIVAFWNAPMPDPNHHEKAAEAALQSRVQSEELNRRWESFNWPIMRTRYGLHVGEAVIGNIGLPDRLEYSALGDSLNVASRLEGLNKAYGTQILVSDAIVSELPGKFITRHVDRVMPKGTSIPFGIHELMGKVGGGPGLEPTDAQIELADLWNRTVVPAYQAQEWEDALEAVQNILKRDPSDPVARIYLDRCKLYRLSPPKAGWDGVEHFTVK